jgi:hypothetical protein
MSKSINARWSHLGRQELVAFGRTLVTKRLEAVGCTVDVTTGGPLVARTPSGGSVQVFVSTQRVGGYAFWTKRRLHPASDVLAAIVVLGDDDEPGVYLVPSTDWASAEPPLTDRDNVGKRSEPEYGISLARRSLPALERYVWNAAAGREAFR